MRCVAVHARPLRSMCRREGMEEKPMTGRAGQRWHAAPLLMLMGLVAMSPLVLAEQVWAHANLLRAVPESSAVLQQPPARVTLWFSERIALDFSTIQVLDAQGRRMDNDDNAVDQEDATALTVTLRPVPHGLYTVAWKNVSMVDGHRVRGSFAFAVGESIRSGQVTTLAQPLFQSPSDPVLRWLVLLSTLAVVGGLGFVLLVSQALLARRPTPDPVRRVGTRLVTHTVRHIWLVMGGLLVAAVGQLVDPTSV